VLADLSVADGKRLAQLQVFGMYNGFVVERAEEELAFFVAVIHADPHPFASKTSSFCRKLNFHVVASIIQSHIAPRMRLRARWKENETSFGLKVIANYLGSQYSTRYVLTTLHIWSVSPMNQVQEICSICGCEVHRSGEYASPTVLGRSHATEHHFVAERFFGRSTNRRGSKRERLFSSCPWGYEHATGVYCYECHEELIHNPVLLPEDIQVLAELVRQRNLHEERKPQHREKIAGRIMLLHDAISMGLKVLSGKRSHQTIETVEITTVDGVAIRRYRNCDLVLMAFYQAYNEKYFGNSLPSLPVYWASEIRFRDGRSANALFVPPEMAPHQQPFIVLCEKIQGVEPLPRQCVIHEMIHVKINGIPGHPKAYIDELQRVLNLDGWEVMGCM
jgi:hypothetical protein